MVSRILSYGPVLLNRILSLFHTRLCVSRLFISLLLLLVYKCSDYLNLTLFLSPGCRSVVACYMQVIIALDMPLKCRASRHI